MNCDQPLTPKLQGNAENNLAMQRIISFPILLYYFFLAQVEAWLPSDQGIRSADIRAEVMNSENRLRLKQFYASRYQCEVKMEMSVAQAATPKIRTIVPALFVCAYFFSAQGIQILIINLI